MKKQDDVLREAIRLCKMGFSIIYLHPRQKNPIDKGWTTLPNETESTLREKYVPGFNIGVRTGKHSFIDKRGYLACIDVDVKDPKYTEDAIKTLRELLDGKMMPAVFSGGKHGSSHYYCLTKEPFKMITVAKHPGWEICVYSNGRQMVLPPSIHPNSANYKWIRSNLETLDFLDFSKWQKEKSKASFTKGTASSQAFKAERHVDFDWLPIPDSIRALIKEGKWKGEMVQDRSAYLLLAATGLLKAGLSRDEILSVLSDRSLFLGQCAYDHAKTDSKARAIDWLWNYTVKRVFSENDAKTVFKEANEYKPELALTNKEVSAQSDEFSGGSAEERGYWVPSKRQGGKPVPDYEALFEAFCEECPYKTVADMKTIYTFRNTHYVDITPIEVKAFVQMKMVPTPEEKVRQEFLNWVLASNVVRRDFFVDTIEGCFNFQNGVLELDDEDGGLKDHSPEYGFRSVLPYHYDAKARCPQFKKWLNDVMLGDFQLQAILQEYMGYVIRGGEYQYHKALWLGGEGRNGKSTFIDVLKAIIGHDNYSTISIKSLMQDKFAGADLDGKLANFSEETSRHELSDSGPFKNLTGDGDITVQKKFGDPYRIRNRAKLIMTYNAIPDVNDLSRGMLSRPLIVPFRKQIAEHEQDRQIKRKLFEELPGIFNFALEGWHRLEKQGGFTRSPKSEYALQQMREESDAVFQWIESSIEFAGDDFMSVKQERSFRPVELYQKYLKGTRYPLKFIDFCRRLSSHPEMKKRQKLLDGKTIYREICRVIEG